MENVNLGLEEQELDLIEDTKEPTLKEYQKLLIIENNRKDAEKALNLLKFGCFEQKEEETVDFSVLELVDGAKPYKGAYKLYRNTENYELLYVLPLVEDNKGDENERTDLAPYAYDVIYIEQMDAETYAMVYQAAKRNLPTFISRLYVTSWVLYIVNALIALVMLLWTCFTSQATIMETLTMAFFYFGTYLAGALITMPLMVLLTIKYKKYKEEK
jgi:hypothetical protein